MAGNSFGKCFVITTCGESHGPALLAIVDGCPPGLALSEQDIQLELNRRRPGQSHFTTQRKEADQVRIVSGVFEGVTTGAPIGLIVENNDQRTSDYIEIKDLYRPGHADYTYHKKYGVRDYRGGGRASARETVMRVAAGAIAKKYLFEKCNIKIQGYLSAVGTIKAELIDFDQISQNPFFFPDPSKLTQLEEFITQLRREGDSIGARVNVVASGVPLGLGEPVFSRLDADIAAAMMSINASKAVEIGDGIDVIVQKGSEHRDEMNQNGFTSNHAGGILGGISSGQDICVSVAFKPASSIMKQGQTINIDGEPVLIKTKGRHDPCIGIRAVPIVESMMALVLIDHYLLNKTINGDYK